MTLNNLWEDYFKNYTNNFIKRGKNLTALIFGLSDTGKSTIMGTKMNSLNKNKEETGMLNRIVSSMLNIKNHLSIGDNH